MVKPGLALLSGALVFAQAALAHEIKAETGRYQVIPGAMVPGKAGQTKERAILLDSATGQTWVLSPGPQFGGLPGPLWEPLSMKPKESGKSAASPGKTNSASTRVAPAPAQPANGKQGRLGERYEYEDNP